MPNSGNFPSSQVPSCMQGRIGWVVRWSKHERAVTHLTPLENSTAILDQLLPSSSSPQSSSVDRQFCAEPKQSGMIPKPGLIRAGDSKHCVGQAFAANPDSPATRLSSSPLQCQHSVLMHHLLPLLPQPHPPSRNPQLQLGPFDCIPVCSRCTSEQPPSWPVN